MSSRRGDGKGKNVAGVSTTDVDQLNQGLGDMSLNSSQGSGWDVSLKKNTNDAAWGSWGQAHAQRNGGAIPPPLQGGWNWKSRPGSTQSPENVLIGPEEVDDGKNDRDELDDSEDELVSDDYDSDDSETSHDSRKKNVWFADFFGTLDGLTVDQINEPVRQWHCPACQNGPGSIHWFIGLQALLTHVKTKGSKRVKIHQDFADLLEEELRRRGAMVVPAGESYGRWKGLDESVKDREIVWPPMVIIMNTQLEQDENETWQGMGNPELLDYFSSYDAMKARSSFGPKGHRGMSVLIFETSSVGYLEAERLCQHFEHQGTDRNAWDLRQNLFYPGGKRQLYGFMATKNDLDIFNQHSHGKLKLKFELVSYQEKVVDQLKQMNEDNQQLIRYKNKIAKQERDSKALKEAFELLSEKLRKLEEEKRIVRERTQLYHEQNKEEMDFQEQFFKDQLKVIQDARNAQEAKFEKLRKEEGKRVEKSCVVADDHQRKGKVEDKGMKELEEERAKVIKLQEEERAELKLSHGKEEIEMEERFNKHLNLLMQNYTQAN